MRYAHVTRAFTCKLTVGVIAHKFIMADESSSKALGQSPVPGRREKGAGTLKFIVLSIIV